MRAVILIACFLPLSLLGAANGVQDESRADSAAIQRAREKVLAGGDYQTDLPNRLSESKAPKSSSNSWFRDFAPSIDLIVRIILGITAVVVLIAFSRFVLDYVQDRKGSAGRTTIHGSPIKGEEFQIDISDIRDFAAQGRHGEAIHLLLLKTVQELCRLTDIEISPAKTSREIAQEIPLDDSSRDDLQALVRTTEISHFGEVPATAADFESCLSRFESFVTNLGGKNS